MKKRLFVAIQYMEIGGVERSLLGLLNSFDYSCFDVDLFVYRHSGELMQFIPSEVNLLPEIAAYTTLTRPITQIVREGYWKIALGRLKAKYKARQFGKRNNHGENYSIYQYVADATTPYLPLVNDVIYDLAISFITPHNIVRDKVNAKCKIAWIHTDYSNIAVDEACELKSWGAYDHIAAVSEDAKRAFVSRFPSLSDKVIVIENILSVNFVREQASMQKPQLDGEIKLLTVGRFCYPKALDQAVRICAKLRKNGVPVKWYAIGYGDEEAVRNAIEECGMHDHFIILGKKTNPYPYIAACDIYVQPSRYEGKAVTVREAQILGKPVVITAFNTSASQLSDGVDGLIVPMDVDGAAYGIQSLIENKQLQEEFRKNMAITDYGNSKEVELIYSML
ncbi:glycosyltransferase [Dysgonomonas sp. Marseille-P4677]|uniref:glycosyltransferase n=1 Tax=Dysgonomonas sp. Marseille-P4677 TaxID=2364790 RepID=UPI001911DAA9|nr:glycosyltransferase [Dysgonomonas sp. Marseille-P4677]MBK5721747.1 glycosyltransferase [Dysgonomonas sp. Marseille-P4677]